MGEKKPKPLEPHSHSDFHLHQRARALEMPGSAPRLCSTETPLSELLTAAPHVLLAGNVGTSSLHHPKMGTFIQINTAASQGAEFCSMPRG